MCFTIGKSIETCGWGCELAIRYIYESIDKANKQIQNIFRGVKKNYQPIWDIVDKRWEFQLHRPLHAANYYLNPR